MRAFLRQIRPALVILICATLACGVMYPALVTTIGWIGFRENAQGSLLRRNGAIVGSSLIGQPFTGPNYFHPRPSAAGDGFDSQSSSGSNLGPTNADLLSVIEQRTVKYRAENALSTTALVPVDAVTASASGLDPHISVANARLQVARVAQSRAVPASMVLGIIEASTAKRSFGILGDEGVSVVKANLALDALG